MGDTEVVYVSKRFDYIRKSKFKQACRHVIGARRFKPVISLPTS